MSKSEDRKGVKVVAAPHPLRQERHVAVIAPGKTVAEIVADQNISPEFGRHAVARIGGEIVPQEWWGKVRPKAGSDISIRLVPRGDFFRNILLLAVIIFAIALPGFGAVAGFLTSAFGAGAGLAGSILTAVVATVGMLIVNVIAPPQSAKSAAQVAADPSVYSLSGGNNSLQPFQPVPFVFGTFRAYPPLGASYYTEIIGNDQYLRMVVVWGYGPLDITDMKIGDTLITDYADVQVETQYGYSLDEQLSLYPAEVVETSLSIELTSAGGYQSRTTVDGVDQVGVDITFPRGLVSIDSTSGNKNSRQVVFNIDFQPVAGGDWVSIADADNVVSSFSYSNGVAAAASDAGGIPVSGASTEVVRAGFRWDVPRGQYNVRIRRVTSDSDDTQIADESAWSAIRTFTNEDPLNFPMPVAKTAIVIRASDQLNGVVDQVNAIVTMIAPDWDAGSGTWITRPTQSPAAAFRRVLQGPALADPQPDDAVDLDFLPVWSEFCRLKGFTFNQYRTDASAIWDTLSDIGVAGRASPALKNGKWSVVADIEQDTPVQYFTPRNSLNFSGEKAFLDVPHAYRVQFANEQNGYVVDERIVYRTGFDASNATLFEQITPVGITNPDHVFLHATFAFAQALLRPEQWTFDADWEAIESNRGDLVHVTHDVLSIGLGSGRVKSLTHVGDDTTNITAVQADETFTMEDGKSYAIAVRSLTDALHIHAVVTVAGKTKSLQLVTPVAAGTIAVGDLMGFGLAGSVSAEAMVTKVSPNADHGATVACIPYSRSIYATDDGVIPPYVPTISPQEAIPPPSVRQVISDESVLRLNSDGTLVIRCQIVVAGITLAGATLEVQKRPSGTNSPYTDVAEESRTGTSVTFSGVNQGEIYDIRARWNVANRLPGPWSYSTGQAIIGKGSPPSALTGLTLSLAGGNVILRWDSPPDLDVRFGGIVRFRQSYKTSGADWSDTVSIGQAVAASNCMAVLPLKEGTYITRVYDSSGIPALTTTGISSKQATITSFTDLESVSEAPDFTGTKSGVVAETGFLHLAATGLVDDITVFDDVDNLDALGGIVTSGTYNFANAIDLESVQKLRLTSLIQGVIANVNDHVDSRPELVDSWEDFDGIGTASADVQIQERHTDDDPGGSPAYSPWQRLDSGEFETRAFQFRALFSSADAGYDIHATELSVRADQLS